MNLKVVTEPISQVVDIQTVKEYLRIDYNDEDMVIQTMIQAAVGHVEQFIRRSLAPKTYELTVYDVDTPALPNPPVTQVDSVEVDGEEIIFKTFENIGKTFVQLNQPYNKAVITYKSGYEKIPKPIEQAIYLLVSHFYENRETVVVGTSVVKIPFSVESLLYPYKGWF